MKRFVKYTAILGTVLTVLGFGTAWAAKINGGRWDGRELWGTSISLPYYGRHHDFSGDYRVYAEADASQQLDKDTLIFPLAKDLCLDLEAGKVLFKTGEDQEIRIVCKDLASLGDLVQFQWEDDEDKLEIYMGPASNVGYLEVEVIIPKDYLFRDVELFVGAGQCQVEEIRAEELEIGVAAGAVEVLDGTTRSAEFECAAGKLEYTGSITGDVDCQCAAGKVGITLHQEETDFNYTAEGMGGNIQIGGSNIGGLAFERNFDYGASRKMDLECATGNIQVRFTGKISQEEW